MKKIWLITLLCFLIAILTGTSTKAQTSPGTVPALGISDPWTDSQLLEPSVLVGELKDAGANSLVIFNIGAVEDIKGAKHIGAASNPANLEKLKNAVGALAKNTAMVIYCGCCPFSKCPNIRPAFLELKKLGFANVKVLNLPTNLKTNWIAKGYPLAGGE
ncbi:MAG TPA: rhodanese-like domain-containing protein [Mucilaginibacter sp.]